MNTTIVHSCSYVICNNRNTILEAWLASCVGVAIFDRQAGISGLIHLLLPAPTGAHGGDSPFAPETYASLGLPLFIKGLIAAGASPDRLEAHVAGGSLVAPVTHHDLSLNIGGRTTEVVLAILKRERIAIKQIEAGGYLTCKMLFNPATWETTIHSFQTSPESPDIPPHRLNAEEITQAVRQIKPIPQIILKIMQMVNESEYGMMELAQEVRQDQVISGMVLALANSALFAKTQCFDSIDRALTFLGEKKFLSLAITAGMGEVFPNPGADPGGGYSLCRGGFYHHALGTAIIAETLARLTERASPSVAYTAGLLHDIGKIALDQYVASAFSYFYFKTQKKGMELVIVEEFAFGIDHPQIGLLVGQQWSLPENLLDVIRYHHYPEHAQVDRELVTLVYLADLLMSRFGYGYDLEKMNTDQLSSRLKLLGLRAEQFPELVDRLPRNIFQYEPSH